MVRKKLIRAGALLAIGVIAVLAALCGLGFLVAAAYMAMATVMPAPTAALATGLAALILACAGLFAAFGPRRRPSHGVSRGHLRSGNRSAEHEGSELRAAAAASIARNPRAAAAIALVSGILVGASPAARREVLRTMREILDGRA